MGTPATGSTGFNVDAYWAQQRAIRGQQAQFNETARKLGVDPNNMSFSSSNIVAEPFDPSTLGNTDFGNFNSSDVTFSQTPLNLKQDVVSDNSSANTSNVPPERTRTISQAELYRLATMSIIEAGPSTAGGRNGEVVPAQATEQVKVAQTVLNRVTIHQAGGPRYNRGNSITDAVFAPGQYVAMADHGLNPNNTDTEAEAIAAVRAASGMNQEQATREVRNLVSNLSNPEIMRQAADSLQGRPEFRAAGDGINNNFRYNSNIPRDITLQAISRTPWVLRAPEQVAGRD